MIFIRHTQRSSMLFSRRATTTTACIATNHAKRDHNYLMRDYHNNVKK